MNTVKIKIPVNVLKKIILFLGNEITKAEGLLLNSKKTVYGKVSIIKFCDACRKHHYQLLPITYSEFSKNQKRYVNDLVYIQRQCDRLFEKIESKNKC